MGASLWRNQFIYGISRNDSHFFDCWLLVLFYLNTKERNIDMKRKNKMFLRCFSLIFMLMYTVVCAEETIDNIWGYSDTAITVFYVDKWDDDNSLIDKNSKIDESKNQVITTSNDFIEYNIVKSPDRGNINNLKQQLKVITQNNEKLLKFSYAKDNEKKCIPSKVSILPETLNKPSKETVRTISKASSINANITDFTFNENLLTSFNTVTGPVVGNGANEPKFSYNSFLEEKISDYSGELTLNFEDLVLDGRNGLDLRIGRTYQTVAANPGEKSIMILPNENGYLRNTLVNNYSTYFLDRYNLGMGWSFSFPSIQVETEYIPQKVVDTYYYDEESELYYHSGNGEVFQVQFTPDVNDSNLKGYYNKDIQFNRNDKAYSNGQVTSYYSMTLADKTKQYFAEDGRLIGIVDRFGNTIKFEHKLYSITNRVPEGNFKNDNEMWTASKASNGTYDAIPSIKTDIGSNDGHVMYFRRNNEHDDTYIISQPIQIKPLTYYDFGMRFKSEYGDNIKVEIIGYDTAYNVEDTKTMWITDYDTENWVDFTDQFAMSSAIRYIQILIRPEYAEQMYIDTVSIDEPKPLISKITDSIGRTVVFDYNGGIDSLNELGTVTLTVLSPDGQSNRVLTYNKFKIEYTPKYQGYDEQRLFWYLGSSATEGEDGSTVSYTYDGGSIIDADGKQAWIPLYMRYDTKTHSSTDGGINKPLLSAVRYKDRKKIYEYETVRKHLGDDGYYDTLRIKKKYDMYSYVPEGDTKSYFKGELGTVNYSYSGTYNGNSFDNETGYPSYTFDDETTLNEQWTVTKSGKTTDTTTFSNCAVIQQTSSSDGTTVKSDYINHSTFKNSPTQIKNTITQNGSSKSTYILYSYNDWGGIASETKEIDEGIKTNASLLEKYTTTYKYDTTYHYITQKSYYNNIDSPQVHEINTFNSNGLLTSSENSVKEKTNYYYENPTYPFLVTKTTMDDPMRFHNLIGGDRIVNYTYDSYGLYPLTISQVYDGGVSNTNYVYDYITGDILKEILPDGSDTMYEYYSDGKLKLIYSPFVQYLNGRLFYTIEYHIYDSNIICENYDIENPTYDVEQINYYRVFTDEGELGLYGGDINFYDAVGNLKMNQKYDFSKTDENNYYLRYSTKYYHDSYDRLIKTVDNENHSTTYTYDGFDRPLTVTDSENNVYIYTYNSVQNKVDLTFNGVTESTNRQLMTQYFDLYGNVIENVVYPHNSSQTLSETYEYDLNNNTISYTNANGNKTEYLYDAANRLRETVLPNGVKAGSTYSAFNEPAFEKIYDEDGIERSSRITYRNEKGDLSLRFFNYDRRMVDSDGYSSDAKGRIISVCEGENTFSYIYDQANHPIILTSGNSQIHRRYNWHGEVSAISTDENAAGILYGYDALGNLGSKTQNNDYKMFYVYSTTGNIMQSTMPSSRTESYTYTANGNLDTITSDNKTFDYDYYDTGYVKSITYPNGLKTNYEYDNINRITKVITTKNGSAINTFEYEYDSNGNTTKEIRNGAETAYIYDSLDRLLSVTYSDGSSVTYEYDALNNRTKETYSNGDVKDYVYDTKYQLKEIKLNGQITDTFTYNESGAVVTHNDKTYTYDEWDRMSGYSDGTNTYTYKYDANGIRTQKNDKQYIIDINNNVVAEIDSTGAVTDEILWGHQPLARKTNGSWYYYIYNAHGDVVGLVNDSGTVVNTYEYTPWGEIHNETETVDNPIKYAGEYYDDEIDMIYLRARYYNPQIGRFTSLDIEEGEIAIPLDMNRYVYCRNNPIKYIDPSGQAVLAASAALLALGKAVQIVAGVVSIVALSALTAYQINSLTKSASYSSTKSASYYMDWGKDENGKRHVLKGSKGSEGSHGPIWKKFNIDPNNNNDWWKLLPILQQVVDKGSELKRVGVYEHGKVIGHNVYYVKQYVDKGVEVIVRLYVNLKGEVWFSDAWGNFLK